MNCYDPVQSFDEARRRAYAYGLVTAMTLDHKRIIRVWLDQVKKGAHDRDRLELLKLYSNATNAGVAEAQAAGCLEYFMQAWHESVNTR